MSVPSSELGPPTPSHASECVPPNQSGGDARLRVRGWGSQFGRLEKKPIALCLLCSVQSVFIMVESGIVNKDVDNTTLYPLYTA
jgi:hypothetical protein